MPYPVRTQKAQPLGAFCYGPMGITNLGWVGKRQEKLLLSLSSQSTIIFNKSPSTQNLSLQSLSALSPSPHIAFLVLGSNQLPKGEETS